FSGVSRLRRHPVIDLETKSQVGTSPCHRASHCEGGPARPARLRLPGDTNRLKGFQTGHRTPQETRAKHSIDIPRALLPMVAPALPAVTRSTASNRCRATAGADGEPTPGWRWQRLRRP